MDPDLLLYLLLNPCGMLTAGAVMYVAGDWATAGKQGMRRLGAALAGVALIAAMFFGFSRRLDLFSLGLGAAGFGIFVLGTVWIVSSLLTFIFSGMAAAMEPRRREPEPPVIFPEVPKVEPPPPPPPPTIEEQTKQVRQQHEEECNAIRSLGLDSDEERIALDQARQRLMRRLRKLLP